MSRPITANETRFVAGKSRRSADEEPQRPKPAWLIAYRAFSDLAGKGSLFVITVVAARRLSQQAFGVFSLASTLGWMLAVATDFGIQMHLARSVARDPAGAARALRTWFNVRLWTAATAILLVVLGLVCGQQTSAVAAPIVLFAVVYLVSGLIEFLHYFYRGLSRSDIESSLTLWQRLTTLGCAMVALIWRPDLIALGVAMLLPVVVTFGVSLHIAGRLAREGRGRGTGRERGTGALLERRIQKGSRPPSAREALWPEFRRDVLPIGAGLVLSALYFRIDVFLIELWRGTEAVANYNAVFRLVEALRLFPAAVLAVALPSLCRAGDTRPLIRVSLAVTTFAVAATVVLWAAAGWMIPLLYGAPFALAVPTFRILILSFPLLSLNYALTTQLIGWDGQRAYAAICGLALVANVGLNARLIPALAIDGAAWATLGTEVFLTVACGLVLWMGGLRRAPGTLPAGIA